jgi:predicted 3-demethylubiquinone-9 3-methyltransferase (glyoxalase superfamily)
MASIQRKARITPFLWFDSEAEDAARQYASIFPNSRITTTTRYSEAGREHHGKPPGSVMVVAFELDNQPFAAINGGPMFKFNEAISLVVNCDSQQEIDHYWAKLGDGGDPNAQQCGWLKDRYGVSWQVVPSIIGELMSSQKASEVMAAVMPMKKIDLAKLKQVAGL